jgi:hypothetical protein
LLEDYYLTTSTLLELMPTARASALETILHRADRSNDIGKRRNCRTSCTAPEVKNRLDPPGAEGP